MPTAPLTLYYRPGACALAPHILLHHVGADHTAVKAPRDDSFRQINPSGAVPVIELQDGDVLTQCSAILQFIAESADRDDLLGGAALRDRAEVAKWCAFFTGDFHPAFFPVFVPHRYVSSTDDAVLAGTKKAGQKLVRGGLDLIEAHLSVRDWFVDNALTVADFYAVPMLRWATLIFESGLSDWPGTQAFYDRICAAEATKAAMSIHQIKP